MRRLRELINGLDLLNAKWPLMDEPKNVACLRLRVAAD